MIFAAGAEVYFISVSLEEVREIPMNALTFRGFRRLCTSQTITLRQHLESIPREQFPVLILEVKEATGLDGVSEKVWRRIKDLALEDSSFTVKGMRFDLAA